MGIFFFYNSRMYNPSEKFILFRAVALDLTIRLEFYSTVPCKVNFYGVEYKSQLL